MIFVVTYKDNIEAVFFHIWDAQQHINFFDQEEQEQMQIIKVDEYKDMNLQNLSKNLQQAISIADHESHCCGNCSRTQWLNGLFVCNFTKEEANPNDVCIHYV